MEAARGKNRVPDGKTSMRIVFMGTPDFAVPCLKALIEAGHEIAGVFTQPDKPKNRGHQLTPPPVKVCAQENGCAVFQPASLKTGEAQALLRALAPELIVVVAYGKILPQAVLDIPKHGCINVHASLLPKYRGAGPIQWSILNGETETGITTMYMAQGIDTGDMLLQVKTDIGPDETADELHDRLSVLGAQLLTETIYQLEEGKLAPIPQDDALSCYAPMLTKDLCAVDFSKPAGEVHNRIRGLYSWPCAQTSFAGKRLKLCHSSLAEGEFLEAPGTIADVKRFLVVCGDKKAVILREVQPEGGKRMAGADFLRGRHAQNGDRLGE